MDNVKNFQLSEEEPSLSYFSTLSNYGVQSITAKTPKNLSITFSPREISLSNTIMMPQIKLEGFIEKNKNICEKSKVNSTRFKSDSSKDEKNILNDEKPVIKILIENDNSKNDESINTKDNEYKNLKNNKLEINPFYLGNDNNKNHKKNSEKLKKRAIKMKSQDNNLEFLNICRKACNNIDNELEHIKINKNKIQKIRTFNISTRKNIKKSTKKNRLSQKKLFSEKNKLNGKDDLNSNEIELNKIRNSAKQLILYNNIQTNTSEKSSKNSLFNYQNIQTNKNIRTYHASLFNKNSSSKLKMKMYSNNNINTNNFQFRKKEEKVNINEKNKKVKFSVTSQKLLKIGLDIEEKKDKKRSDRLKPKLELKSPDIENIRLIKRHRTKSSHLLKNKNSRTSPKENNLNNRKKTTRIIKKKLDFESALKNKNNLANTQFNLFSPDKFTNTQFCGSDYCEYTLDCMDLILNKNKSQKQSKAKVNFNFPKSTKNRIKKKIALFDLDETLVHCTGDITLQNDETYQYAIDISLPGNKEVKVGINIRPLWKKTLNLIRKYYYIVVFTASHQAYADAVLNFMDPNKKYFKYRLYRNNCSLVDVDGAKFYVKDLDIFDEYYDLKDIVIVDNSVLSFIYHLENGIPIVPYYSEDKDGSLYVVGLYLVHIFHEKDLREANKKYINLDSFLNEAKNRNQHESSVNDDNSLDKDNKSNKDDNRNININKNNNNELSDKKEELNINNNNNNYHHNDKKRSKTEKEEPHKIFNENNEKRLSYNNCNNNKAQNKLIKESRLFNAYYGITDKCLTNKLHDHIIEEKTNKSFSSDEEKDIIKDKEMNKDIMTEFFKQKYYSTNIDNQTNKVENQIKSNKSCHNYFNLKMIRSSFRNIFPKEVNNL